MNDRLRYPHILGKLINRPLMAHPRTAVTIYNALCGRFGTAPAMMPQTEDAELVDHRLSQRLNAGTVKASRYSGDFVTSQDAGFPKTEPFRRTSEGIGIATIDGELVNRGAWVGANSGMVSYEGIGFQLSRMARDQKTKIAVLDINSPGGEAIGAGEIAAKVRELAAIKPVYAVVNGMAASAGYAIASGATRIITTESGISGSIGVVMMHLDMSEAFKKEGIAPTLIFAGSHKVDGNFTEPLSDSVKEELQNEVNSFYELFTSTVGAGRGRRLSKEAARKTQARTYIGKEAVDAGIADDVGSFDELLSEATAKLNRAARSQSRSKGMNGNLLGSTEASEQENEEAIRRARAEGEAAGASAVQAYQTKLKAIMASDQVKGREAHAMELLSDQPELSAESIIKICAKIPVAAAPAATSAHPSIEERQKGMGTDQISAGPVAGSQTNILPGATSVVGQDWGPLMEEQNRLRRKQMARRRAG